jgi:hypothetical protein
MRAIRAGNRPIDSLAGTGALRCKGNWSCRYTYCARALSRSVFRICNLPVFEQFFLLSSLKMLGCALAHMHEAATGMREASGMAGRVLCLFDEGDRPGREQSRGLNGRRSRCPPHMLQSETK